MKDKIIRGEEEFSVSIMKYFGEKMKYSESIEEFSKGINIDRNCPGYWDHTVGFSFSVWFVVDLDISGETLPSDIMEVVARDIRWFHSVVERFEDMVGEKLPKKELHYTYFDNDEGGFTSTVTLEINTEEEIETVFFILNEISQEKIVELDDYDRYIIPFKLIEYIIKKSDYSIWQLKKDLDEISKNTRISKDKLLEFARIMDMKLHCEFFLEEKH